MTFLTSPETVVQMCFLESLKPVIDQFLQDFSNRRTFNPCFALRYAASIEASDVQILEAEWNSGEDCKWTAEVGFKKGGTPIERWWIRNWYKNQKSYKWPKASWESRSNVILVLGLSSQVSQLPCRSPWHLGTYLLKLLLVFTQIQKTGIRSVQKKRVVGSSLLCVKPEELTSFDIWVESICRNRYPTRMGTGGRWNTCQNWSILESKFFSWRLH